MFSNLVFYSDGVIFCGSIDMSSNAKGLSITKCFVFGSLLEGMSHLAETVTLRYRILSTLNNLRWRLNII